MKVDYIIVGLGLAGLAFTNELLCHKKSFVVFEDNSQNSSIVAGGVYNPVILKRFTPVWEAENQLKIAIPFYEQLEKLLNNQYDFKFEVQRIFKSIEEQNNWFIACDHPQLSNYMVSAVDKSKYEGVTSDFGFGKLVNTGRIDTKKLLEDYRVYLQKMDAIRFESFNYDGLEINDNNIEYKDIVASKIVFCEGYGMKSNPYFNYLPMQEAKGELLTIHAPNLNVEFLIKAAVFVLPLGDNIYKVGATFNWKDKTLEPTEEGKKELLEKLDSFITVPYTVIEQFAGIRPTVKDRRPLVGCHSKYKNIAILNGLGTRGVMIAPTAAKQLYNFLENKEPLNPEYAIDRFS